MPANEPLVMGIRPYTPDLPAFSDGASAFVKNVLPRTNVSYGPMSDIAPFTLTPLTERCQGAAATTDAAGDVIIFAGSATKLWWIKTGYTAFQDATAPTGPYNIAADHFWKFTSIKGRMIATNITDPIQSFIVETGTQFTQLSSDAPKARYCAGIKQWLMVANTNDPIGGIAPWRIWWSAINDPTSWPQPGTSAAAAVQSDYTDLVGENGKITGIVGNLGTSEGAVFFEHAVWRIVYVGPPAVFDFFPAQGVKGTQAPASIVQLGAYVYYLGEDGFYVFDGTNSKPIGDGKVDKTFFADLDRTRIFRVCGAVDPVNKVITWAYPGKGHNNGNPNRMVHYNWAIDRWSYGELECEFLFRSLTLGYTLDGLDIFGPVDDLGYSLDSEVWMGGALELGFFDTAHFLSFRNNVALEATVDMEEIQPFNGKRTFVRNTRPIVDGGSPTVAIGTRETLESPTAFNFPTAMNSLGWCPQRASGRYTRGRVTIPAGSTWTHIQGVEIDADPIGVR